MTVRLKIESRGENGFSGDLCYHHFDQWDANKYAGVGSKRFSVLNNRSPSAKHSKYKESPGGLKVGIHIHVSTNPHLIKALRSLYKFLSPSAKGKFSHNI